MPSPRSGERGHVAIVILAILVLLLCIGPLVLHCGQKRHDQLPFDVEQSFPPDKEFVPGEAFGTTLAEIMEHELEGTTGWRPNDFFLWGPSLWADNNANRQLGIIQAVRESTRVFRDNLTKVSATEFDPNLAEADTAFRNDAKKFWLPSAESKFRKGAKSVRAYVAGLKSDPQASKPMNLRNIDAIKLFQAWTDVLGGAHANLYKETEADGSSVPMWHTDNYFFHAQGNTHVMYHLTRALKREYQEELKSRPTVAQLFEEVSDALGKAAVLKPITVLDGSPASPLANHRRNLLVYVDEARQKMYSIREELIN